MTTLKNANVFKGILQYKSTDNFTKETGYMYLIREFNENGEETGNAEIYFGKRKYGDVNISQTGGLDNILEEINKLAQETANSKPVTYSELKSLRDNGNLIPGQKYRITDYVTAVNKPNIESAGHPFNIIVEALNEYTLSERAKAIQDENDGYFDSEYLEAWDLWYCLDNDTSRFDWGISTGYDSSSCAINSDLIEGNAFKTPFAFSGCMWNDPINGDEYDSKVENDLIYEWGLEEEPNGSKSLYLLKSDVDIYNEEGTVDTYDKFYYRGVIEVAGIEYDYWQKYDVNRSGYILGDRGTQFVLTERIVEGNIIESQNGKGIIYRMIDEYGNDCPYDFKNIMFKRPNAEDIGDDNYYFTFSWVEEGGNIMDASICGNNGYLHNDDYDIPGVFSNVIGKYIENGVNKLPVNIFIGNYNYDKGWYYGCRNNTFGNNCNANSFGNNCHNNSFGTNCNANTFGNNCHNNSFGNYCFNNSFGENCSNNSFDSNCYNNTFDIICYGNIFGDACFNNSFGSGCEGNTFGINCYSNSFGNSCKDNTFGNKCFNNSFSFDYYNNTFGNNCYRNKLILGFGCHSNTFGNYCYENNFEGIFLRNNYLSNGCNNIIFYAQTDEAKYIQNLVIAKNINNEEITISDSLLNANYEIKVAKNSAGEIKIYCEADLIA